MKIKKIFSIVLSVVVSFSFVFAVTYAATTISTDINTGGTLTVTGNSTLTSSDIGGGYTAGTGSGATISATGAISANGNLAINGFATTTASNGNFATAGALTVTGLSTLLGGATTTTLTLLNGEIISNATDGVIQLGGVASTTSITLLNGETITNATDGTIALTGALTVSGVSSFTGLSTFLGGATTTILTLLNGETITNATDGTIVLNAATTSMTGGTFSNGFLSQASSTVVGNLTVTGTFSPTQTAATSFLVGGGYGDTGVTLSAAGAISADGLATLAGGATTTILTLLNGEIISNATDGVIQLGGIASTTSLTLLNGETITNATDGEVQVTATTLKLIGTASTSAIRVGDEPAAPEIQGMVFGYCSFGDVTTFTASTTKYADCTTVPAGALLAGDRVFVQATSSFDSMFVITAASTTGVSTINLRILNTGLDGAADETLGGTSINFWAVR